MQQPKPSLPENTVIKVNNLPKNYDEVPLRKFFSQFAPVERVRLIRNEKTGTSQRKAFVQFKDAETAQIIQKAVDGYLIFTNILKCEVVKNCHPATFKKFVLNAKIDGLLLKHNAPYTKEEYAQELAELEKRMKEKETKLHSLGLKYKFPKVISIDLVQ